MASFKITSPSAKVRSLEHIGVGDYGLEKTFAQAMPRSKPRGWKSTGTTREDYLDIIEHLLRDSLDNHYHESGCFHDPVIDQTLPMNRFTSAAAIALHFGRLREERERIENAMSAACQGFVHEKSGGGFAINELAMAYMCLADKAPNEKRQKWEKVLKGYVPIKKYDMLRQRHNWGVYASCGEYLRELAGLKPAKPCLWGRKYFEHYMGEQLIYISPEGMYRDPGDPITYDITTRLKYATALALGYRGKWREELDEFTRRGGLSTLLFTSSDGLCPYGGRSDTSVFQEIMIAALCEIEARRYKRSDPKLAGAFKRQAHLCVNATRRWLVNMNPPKDIKNGMDIAHKFGYDQYRQYLQDIHFAATLLGLAVIFADDRIPEYPCPSESSSYVFELTPGFHKVFANTPKAQLIIDTHAELHYNSTGLGRFHRKGYPLELGLGMPIANTRIRWGKPSVNFLEENQPDSDVAIGPAWKVYEEWTSLAELSDGLENQLYILPAPKDGLHFRVDYIYRPKDIELRETYLLKGTRLKIKAHAMFHHNLVHGMRFSVPLLITDGSSRSSITKSSKGAFVKYMGKTYRVSSVSKGVKTKRLDKRYGNRNGVYDVLLFETKQHEIEIQLDLV